MKVLFTILLLTALAAAAQAQTYIQVPDSKALTETVIASSEKIVKGAPFSAEAISESVQVLADGNRIVRNSNHRMYRDSEGRFRREGTAGSGGALASFYKLQSTTIIDPVTGFRYYLNDKKKTYQRSKIRFLFDFKFNFKFADTHKALTELNAAQAAGAAKTAPAARAEVEKLVKTQIASAVEAGTVTAIVAAKAETGASGATTKKESLGMQTIEGVEAEGTRTTTTIPAGAIGNERPIEIIYEKWYSKDLQLIVLSKHSDPRFGDQTYRLVNISRSEPDSSVFTVPADYTVQVEPSIATTYGPLKAIGVPAPPKPAAPPKKVQ